MDAGEIDGVPTQGLRVASVSHHESNRADARQMVAIFLDADPEVPDATRWLEPDRARVAVETFAGERGGDLEGLRALLGKLVNPLPDGATAADVERLVHRRIEIEDDGAPRACASPIPTTPRRTW